MTGRCVFRSSEAIQICPPRVNAISLRSLESVKLAASASPPETRAGLADAGDTVQRTPSLANRISSADTHANDEMSDVLMSGSTGKSVSATGFWPGATTNRSCLPQASQRNATLFPSGDHAGADGYLICEMRSIVMLPRGASAAAGIADDRQRMTAMTDARRFMADDYPTTSTPKHAKPKPLASGI